MEKLKELLSKGWFYACLAYAVIGTYIWYLLTKNSAMEHKVSLTEEKESQAKFRARLEEKEKESKNAEEEYNRIRDEYKRNNGTGGTDVQ